MSEIKKVLFVCSVYKPNVGGVENTIEEMTANLARKGIKSVILTKRYPPELDQKETIGKTAMIRMRRPTRDEEFMSSLEFISQYETDLKSDIVHIIGLRRPMPMYALMLARKWKVPCVMTFAGGDLPQPDNPVSQNLWREGTGTVKEAVRQANFLTAYSRYLARLASDAVAGNRKIRIIYGGINLAAIKAAEKKRVDSPVFFSAGRLDDSKGIDILIRAFALAKRELVKSKLMIAGSGEAESKLILLVRKLNLADDVVFLGNITQGQVFSYMKASAAHICPSRSEGGGLVNYEAQAAGCLAIGSDVGGIPEYIQNHRTGLLFRTGDIRGLAKLLIFAAKESRQKSRLIRAGYERVKQHDWKKFTDDYLTVYQQAAGSNQAKPFHSWSVLTRRMWDNLNMEAVVSENYAFRNPKLTMIRESSDNLVYSIVSGGKPAGVLRISKRDISEDVQFELRWIRALAARGVPVAMPLFTRKRRPYMVIGGKPAVVFEYKSGQHFEKIIKSTGMLEKIRLGATALAVLHNTAMDINLHLPRKRNIFTELGRAIGMQGRILAKYKDGDELINNIKANLVWAKKLNHSGGFIHNDYRIGNVIFGRDKVLAIVDFDWSCIGPAKKDLALALAEWSFADASDGPDTEILRLFLDSYNKTALRKYPLDVEMYKWMAFACLSDTCTYICDSIDDPKPGSIRSSYMYQKYLYFSRKLE